MMRSDQPVCSICIANYNGAGVLRECLDSLAAQIGELSIEIIVHDDASSDESRDLIRREYPGVFLIESAGNVGFCVANNRMVERARGEYILLLNNDASLFPDALQALLLAARQMPVPGILGLAQHDAASGTLLDRGSHLDLFFNPYPALEAGRRDVQLIMGACLWLPRSLWLELGGFPEWFGSIGEDLFLCSLARLLGLPVQVIGESGYRHHVGHSFGGGKAVAGRLSTTVKRRALSERNKSFVLAIVTPGPLLALILPLHLLLLLLEGCTLSLLCRRLGLLRQIYLPCLPALWHRRREIAELRMYWQPRRAVSQLSWLQGFSFWPHKLHMLCRHGLPEVHPRSINGA